MTVGSLPDILTQLGLQAKNSGNPYLADRFKWLDPNANILGNAAGVAGTAKDILGDWTLRPVLGAATVGGNAAENLLASLLNRPGRHAMPTDLSWGGLADYQKQQWGQNPISEIMGEMIVDPLSYVGGPAAKGAEALGAAVPRLAPAMQAIARANRGYEAVAGEAPKMVLGGAKKALTSLPAAVPGADFLRAAFETSTAGQVARKVDELGDALRTLSAQGDGTTRDFEEWLKVSTGAGRRLLDKVNEARTVAKGWQEIEERVMQMDKTVGAAANQPEPSIVKKFVAINIMDSMRAEKEALAAHYHALGNAHYQDVLATGGTKAMANAEKANAVALYYNRVQDLQDSVRKSLDMLDGRDWSAAEAALAGNNTLATDLNKAIDEALLKARIQHETASLTRSTVAKGDALDAAALDEAQKAGLPLARRAQIETVIKNFAADPLTGAPTPDILAQKLSEVGDTATREAAQAANKLVRDVIDTHAPGIDALGLAGPVSDAVLAAGTLQRQAYGDLVNAGAKLSPEYLARAGADKSKVLADAQPALQRAMTALTGVRRTIAREAEPWLTKMTVPEQAKASENVGELVKLMTKYGAGAQEIARVRRAASTFGGIDVLAPDLTGTAVKHRVMTEMARDLGIQGGLHPWYVTGIQLWKEMALNGVATPLANLASGLFFASQAGVPIAAMAERLAAQTRDALPAIRAAIQRGEVPAAMPLHGDVMPLLRDLGRTDAQGNILRTANQARATGFSGEFTAGLIDPHSTAWGKINPILPATGGAVASYAGAKMAGKDDTEAYKAAAAGGLIGGTLSRTVALGRVAMNIIETALRDTAFYTAVEAHFPEAVTKMEKVLSTYTPAATDAVPGAVAGDRTRLLNFFRLNDGRVSPTELAQVAASAGYHPTAGNEIAGLWDSIISEAEQHGNQLSNAIHFDYAEVPNVIEWLRKSGIMPFVTWQSKAMPVMAGILLSQPRFMVLIDEYRKASNEYNQAHGLTGRFHDKVPIDLGDAVMTGIFGRPGTAFVNPLAALLPIMDAMPDENRPEYAQSPVSKALSAVPTVTLPPYITAPLSALGITDPFTGNIFRQSGYVEALTGSNPEAPLKEGMRRVANALGADRPETVTGDAAKDAAIRNRIDEMWLAAGNKGPAKGDYLLAKDNPDSDIWKRAQADVERTKGAQTTISNLFPLRPAFLSPEEATIRQAKQQQGVSQEQNDQRATAEISDQERQAAIRQLQQGGINRPTEAQITALVKKTRSQNAYKAAEKADPTAALYSGNSDSDSGKIARAWDMYNEFVATLPKKSSPARTARIKAFFDSHPDVRDVVSKYRMTMY